MQQHAPCGGSSLKEGTGARNSASSRKAAAPALVRRRHSNISKLRPKSMHEAVFWRSRLAAAMRTAWACFMAGVIIQVGSTHVHWVTFPIFAYVMAVTVVGESTLGKAMQDTVAVVTGTLQGVGMSLVLLQILPPAKCFSNMAVSITLVAATSFLITYPSSSHILHKRVALAHSGIIYVTAAVQQQQMDQVFFPLRLAGTTIVGATCGMLALLLPLPHLAVLQVYPQTKLSARITSERLKVLVDAFTTKDVTQASALSLQAKSLAKLGAAVHAEISSNEGDMGWEAQRFRLRTSRNLQHVTRGLTSLRKTAVGLELALQADIHASSSSSSMLAIRPRHSNIMSKQLQVPARRLNYMMKQSLIYLTDWVSLALGHASTDIKHRSSSSHTHRQVILEEGNEVLSNFDESLLAARQWAEEHLEYMTSGDNILEEALGPHDDDPYSDSDAESSSSHEDADSSLPAYHHHPHHRHYCHRDSNLGRERGVNFTYSESSENMLDMMCKSAKKQLANRVAAGEMGEEYNSDPILGEVPMGLHTGKPCCHLSARPLSYDANLDGNHADADSDFFDTTTARTESAVTAGTGITTIIPHKFEAEATAFFFLFNVKMFVQETKNILLSLHQEPKTNPYNHPASTRYMHYSASTGGGAHDYVQSLGKHPDDDVSKLLILNAANSSVHYVAHGADGLHYDAHLRKLCSKCAESGLHASTVLSSRPKERTKSSLAGLCDRLCHKLLGYFTFRVDPVQLMAAFKMALAMAIGAFLGFWFNRKKGYWADITLALGYTGPAKGGSFRVAVLRSLGTVSGSIYGLLVVMATKHFPVMRLVALIPWVVFTSFLRQSKIFGYAGAVSAFTGAIVILARTTNDSSDQEFTVIRIVEAFLGMASFIIVEVLVFPRRSASMVKPEIVSGLGKMRQLVSSIFDAFSGEDCDECGGYSIMDELKTKEKNLRSLISRQNALVKEASEEPQFWFAAFPAKIFMKLMEEQGKIMEMLHFSMAALEEIKQVGKETKIPMNRLLSYALSDAMRIMEEKVVPTFEFLEKVMSMRAQQCQRFPNDQLADAFMSPAHAHAMSALAAVGAATAAASKTRDIEAARNLPELESLMREEWTAKNIGRAFKHSCDHFEDVAAERGKRFMDAFERGVVYVANELAALQARAGGASPTLPATAQQQQRQQQHTVNGGGGGGRFLLNNNVKNTNNPAQFYLINDHLHPVQQHEMHSPITSHLLQPVHQAAAAAAATAVDAVTAPYSPSAGNERDVSTNISSDPGGNGLQTLTNTVLLSLGTLAFALNGLLHHSSELEKSVHELLQEENPWNLIHFWDASRSSAYLWSCRRH